MIAMLAMMVVSLGVVGVLLLCMRRNAARRNREVEELLEEIAEDERREKRPAASPTPAEKPQAEPWERDGDWWKK